MTHGRIVQSIFLSFISMIDYVFGAGLSDFWDNANREDPKVIKLQELLGDVREWGPRTYPYLLHEPILRVFFR